MPSPAIPVISLDSPDVPLLRAACRDVGFFYLEGHGVSSSLLSDVLDQSERLFRLPREEKERLSDRVMSRGYTAMGEETLDPAVQTRGDTKEGYYVGPEVSRDSPRYDPAKLSGPNVWPLSAEADDDDDDDAGRADYALPRFRPVMERYMSEAGAVGLRLVRLLALAIGLDENRFDADFDRPMAFVRLLRYAAERSDPAEGVFACGAHSDYGMITLLLTDDNPGLQIFTKDGEWIDVPPRSGSFVVNLGDMLERWTNGLFRATRHRVLTAGNTERYSVPFFYEPNFDAVVECLDACCGEGTPPRYPPTTAGEHLLEKYEETHADFEPEKAA